MKLSLRDLFWLVLIVGMGIAFGMEHSRLSEAFWQSRNDVWLHWNRSPEPSEESQKRSKMLAALRELSDDELRLRLDAGYRDGENRSCCLTEAVRRGMKDELRQCYKELMSSESQAHGPDNHELLTALRRAEGKPDPIKIEMESFGKDYQGNPVSYPLIIPKVTNVDVEMEPCWLTQGCDDRSGRHERWRVHLTNQNGVLMEDANFGGFGMGGGIGRIGMLRHGEVVNWRYRIDVRSYVKPPPSGRYTLELVHAEERIVGERNLAGKHVWKSEPVQVIVHNYQETSKWVAIIPPCAILVAALLTGLLALVSGYRTARRWFQLRDWLALTTVALLAFVWSIDIFYMKHVIAQNTSDRHAAWTMELVQPGR